MVYQNVEAQLATLALICMPQQDGHAHYNARDHSDDEHHMCISRCMDRHPAILDILPTEVHVVRLRTSMTSEHAA